MRIYLVVGLLLLLHPVLAQKGDELLVYSLKGNVTVVEDNKESKARIGKVLKPGSTIRTQRDAKLTMVCKEGRPISVTKEGSFPIVLWKDSCSTRHTSVTTKYFQYIWDQLYARSGEKKDLAGIDGVGQTPVRGNEVEIIINEWLDTINYAGGEFPISWTTSFAYTGKYHFVMINEKTKKKLFQDSLSTPLIQLEKLKKYMKPGNNYSWTVATKPTGIVEGGIIRYTTIQAVNQVVLQARKNIGVPETPAAQYFRVAYMLKEKKYFADAYSYLRKAIIADPTTEFYADILKEFKAEFAIH